MQDEPKHIETRWLWRDQTGSTHRGGVADVFDRPLDFAWYRDWAQRVHGPRLFVTITVCGCTGEFHWR